jgi:hypothetical protein
MLAIGILVVGGAHGLINAPIVTHVADLDLARRIGAGSATAAYRFLERIGHVAGPVLVGQLLMLTGQIGPALQGIALVVAILGLLFLATQRRTVGREHTGSPSGRLLGLHLDPPNLTFLLAIDSEGLPLVDRPGRRSRAVASAEPDPADPEGARRLVAFLAPILADHPAGSALRLVGCGDATSYRAVIRRMPMVELHLAADPASWLEELRVLLGREAERASGAREPAGSLARALAEYGHSARRLRRPFVWVRPTLIERRHAVEPVVSA